MVPVSWVGGNQSQNLPPYVLWVTANTKLSHNPKSGQAELAPLSALGHRKTELHYPIMRQCEIHVTSPFICFGAQQTQIARWHPHYPQFSDS